MSKNDQFVVHDGNRLAFHIADLVQGNPLTIYGSGKKDLLLAMENKLKRQNKKVFYVTGTTFRQQIIKILETDPLFQHISVEETSLRLEAFREAFATDFDVVIFDEMETLKDFPSTAAELAQFAMTLLKKRKQLVFAFNTIPENAFLWIPHPLFSLIKSDSGIVLEIQGSEEDRIETNQRKEVVQDDICSV